MVISETLDGSKHVERPLANAKVVPGSSLAITSTLLAAKRIWAMILSTEFGDTTISLCRVRITAVIESYFNQLHDFGTSLHVRHVSSILHDAQEDAVW
jgi:hypothetical protein